MPSTRSFFHKNRSQGSLLNTQESNDRPSYQASPIDTPIHSPRFPSSSAVSPEAKEDDEDYTFGQPSVYRPDEARYYYVPTRSQSQRSPTAQNPHQQPTINLVGPAAGGATQTLDENPDSYYRQARPAAPLKEDSKRRRFFKLSSSSAAKEQSSQSYNPPPANRLGRSISVKRKDPQLTGETVGPRQSQQKWPSQPGPAKSAPHSTEVEEEDEDEDEDEDGGDLTPGRPLPNEVGPPIPEKDPLRSNLPLNSSQQEHSHGKLPPQGLVTSLPQRHPYERQGSATSSLWENTARSVQQHQRAPQDPYQANPSYQPSPASTISNQIPSSYHSSPASATSTSSHPLQVRAPQEALQQYRQDFQRERPPSQQSLYDPPSPLNVGIRSHDSHHERQGSNRSSLNAYTSTSMGAPPPTQQQGQGRRSDELNQPNPPGVIMREGSGYQPYTQTASGQNQPTNAPQYDTRLSVSQQNQQFRGTPQPSPLPSQTTNEQGRSTPPPSRSRDDLASLDVNQILARHDELQEKYRKVKKYYFEKDAQVQQLQNTLAHQRLLQSRTSLDDNEYMNRFSRLDGAINQLAFNIRRDWRTIPPWLAQHVNKDATTSLSKEMTAVGRACISRWLVDELFGHYFHPALEQNLSAQLKIIEKNLRRFAPPTPSEEEREALMSRICNWRLATLDGLHENLSSPAAAENRAQLTGDLVEKLTASLSMLLKEPAPAGVEGGVSMIIELAVGISANLPLESRDVYVNYCLPGSRIDENFMKVESGLPPLTNPGEGLPDEVQGDDTGSLTGGETKDSNETEERANNSSGASQPERKDLAREREAPPQAAKKKGMFGGFMGGNKKGGNAVSNGAAAQQQQQQQQQQQAQAPKEERVRFSAFMAVENRGRSVLVKAPVYTIELSR